MYFYLLLEIVSKSQSDDTFLLKGVKKTIIVTLSLPSIKDNNMRRFSVLSLLFVLACGESKNEIETGETPEIECETTWSVPYCDDSSLPQAGDGCFESCTEGDTCSKGTCTEAWLGCGPLADCDVCGISGWVCLE